MKLGSRWRILGRVPNQPRRGYSKRLSRNLRSNMTESQVMVWAYLQNRPTGVKFRRQVPIGRFIVGFACFESRLIVEIDGNLHCPREDAQRDAWLNFRGWHVARFWAADVYEDPGAVLEAIHALARKRRRRDR